MSSDSGSRSEAPAPFPPAVAVAVPQITQPPPCPKLEHAGSGHCKYCGPLHSSTCTGDSGAFGHGSSGSGATTQIIVADSQEEEDVFDIDIDDAPQAAYAFDGAAAAAATTAAVAAIAATTNVPDDTLSRTAFFESFDAFARSDIYAAFKNTQGLCATV